LSSADIRALTQGSKYIRPLIPELVHKVYKKLLQYDITAQSFTTPSTSYTGIIDKAPSSDSPQIAYRKLFMRGYFQNLISDPTKTEYWAYLDKVGMMHTGRGSGKRNPLNVEYVHIGACLGFIQDCLFEAILSHPRLKIERKIAITRALGKVLWIQNDLFAKWYVRDGEEFREQKQDLKVEKEGYLDGRKVLSTEEFESSFDSFSPSTSEVGTPGEEMQCPFSGMMDRLNKMSVGHNELPYEHST
jgi:hypothetical protein